MHSIGFSPHTEADGTFLFSERDSDNNSKIKLSVLKQETVENAYSLGIRFLGRSKEERPIWEVRINDHRLYADRIPVVQFHGSVKFDIKPHGNGHVLLEETDERSHVDKVFIEKCTGRISLNKEPDMVIFR